MNSTPEPNSFLQFWVIVAFLVMIGSQLVSIVVSLVNRKQQREVTFSFEPASKKEFDLFTATTNANFVQIREEMKADRRENQIHSSERGKALFNEIKSTRQELDVKIESTRQELGEKIDGMEARVIATLKNTNAI